MKQLHWLNHYHAMVRIKVGEELKRQNRMVRRIIHFLKNLSSALLFFDVFLFVYSAHKNGSPTDGSRH
jgi:lipopolysaccharide/colanic/teichoic acid biosynthesis glycosyltransferase